MKAELFREAYVPERYKTRQSAVDFYTKAAEDHAEYEPNLSERLQNIKSILDSEQLRNTVENGFITLGIIKPNANEGINLPETDSNATEEILNEIGRDRIMFQFSIQLKKDQAEKFYAPNKEKHSSIIANLDSGMTIWDSVVDYTSSGPLTFVLIYDKEGKAVESWRESMGATNPKNAEEGTIRKNHATSEMLPNNIVHGSDSTESALREIQILSDIIEDEIQNNIEKAAI